MLDRIALTLKMLPALPGLLRHRPSGRLTAADRLESQARRYGDGLAVLFEDQRITWRELNEAANRVAHWGQDIGLRRGDVVALLMENRPEYLATWAGLAKLGVTTALLNTNLTGRGLQHAIETSGALHLVIGTECLDRLATTGETLPAALQIWVRADPSATASGEAPAGSHDLDAELEHAFDVDPDPAVRDGLVAGDSLFYIYTSGTTGLPKAAHFSHMRFLGIGDLNAWALSLTPDDVFYCALPLYHSAGGVMLVSASLAAGATIALRRRFSAGSFWDDVRRYDATCFQYIGEFCRYLMNQPPRDDDRDHKVRVIVGNGLRPDIWQDFQQRFGIETVREFYGATEGNTALMNLENKVGSVGRYPFDAMSNAALVRYDVENDEHVRDTAGFCIRCENDEAGELIGRISEDRAMGRYEGYTSKEASDSKVLRDVFERGDAYFRTGDLLRRDADGFYYFVDRIGDTFRWKGENVSTQEVAEALSGQAGVEMVNVYGVEVEGQDGRAGMAALVLGPDTEFDATAFYARVDEALPRYAAPLFVRLLPEQEMTGTFKIRKVDLQREGFDPAAIADRLFTRDDTAGTYVPLTPEVHAEIAAGARRI